MNDEVGSGTQKQGRTLRLVFQVLFLLGVIGFAFGALRLLLWSLRNENVWLQVATKNFAAVIGVPMAAVAALCIVLLLEATSGIIEFEVVGLKFKGASGPIVLWVLCFATIAGAIKLLWVP